MPQDNRFDIGVFPTGHVAQIQVAKGYVPVMSGPGSIGGAINIVTRKPAETFEYEATAGAQFGMNGFNGYNASALVGGNDGKVYWQASGAYNNLHSYTLSQDFIPTVSENGGRRALSGNRTNSVNLKLGIIPKGNDEYSINYSGNFGQRSAPLSVNDTVASQRNWRWPHADIQSLYFLSNTGIGNTAYVKTRINYNTFRNALYSYDNANYNTQTLARAFRSYYSDESIGTSIEAGNDFGRDILKGAFFFSPRHPSRDPGSLRSDLPGTLADQRGNNLFLRRRKPLSCKRQDRFRFGCELRLARPAHRHGVYIAGDQQPRRHHARFAGE